MGQILQCIDTIRGTEWKLTRFVQGRFRQECWGATPKEAKRVWRLTRRLEWFMRGRRFPRRMRW